MIVNTMNNEVKMKRNKYIENPYVHRLYDNKKEVYDYRLFINDFNSIGHEIDEIYNKLQSSTKDDLLELQISSFGGYFNDYMRLCNLCKEHFYNRVTSKTHYGFSCGAFAALLGDERIIYQNSQLMFHNVTSGLVGKMSDIEQQFHFDKKYYDKFLKSVLSPYFTTTEIESIWNGKDMWLDALEMCKRKIATQIFMYGDYWDADFYVDFMTNRAEHKKLIDTMYENLEQFNKADADNIKYEYNKLHRRKSE